MDVGCFVFGEPAFLDNRGKRRDRTVVVLRLIQLLRLFDGFENGPADRLCLSRFLSFRAPGTGVVLRVCGVGRQRRV